MVSHHVYGSKQLVRADDYAKATQLSKRGIRTLRLPSRLLPADPPFHWVDMHCKAPSCGSPERETRKPELDF